MTRGLIAAGLGLLLLASCTSTSPGFEREIRLLPSHSSQPGTNPDPDSGGSTPEKTGDLVLRVIPALSDVELHIDGNSASLGTITLSVGLHNVSWRLFGYVDGEMMINVDENRTTFVDLPLEPAEFALTQFVVGRGGRINPDHRGPAGRASLVFHANAPGLAHLEIRAPDGLTVFSDDLKVTTWTHGFHWDGTEAGVALPDGMYLARLSGASATGRPVADSIAVVTLDRNLPADHPGTWSIRAADAAAPGVLSLQLGVSAHGGPVDGSPVWDNRLELSSAFGFLPNWELLMTGTGRVVSEVEFASADAQLGLAWNFQRSNLSSSSLRVLAGPIGFTMGAVGAWYAEPWSLSLLADTTFSTTGLTPEGRIGLRWAPGSFSLDVSGVLTVGPPLVVTRLALELGPEVPLSVGLLLTGKAYAWNDWAFYGGVGLSFSLDTLDIASP